MKKIIFILSLFFVGVLVSCVSYSANSEFLGDGVKSESSLFLPIILRNHPPEPGIFGIQIVKPNDMILKSAQNATVSWVREHSIRWIDVQPSKDDWNWDALASLEEFLIEANKKNLEVILIIHTTPDWAQKYEGMICGPIAEKNLVDFAYFMKEVVKRYSVAPYNVKYWELGNEPDVIWSSHNPTAPYGCWAETRTDDEFYGGGYYAEMLKHVYPAIKSIDPASKIIVGGLLLNCDPTNIGEEGACRLDELNFIPANFFEGILKSGGGNYFDIVSIHGYTQMGPDATNINPIKVELDHPYWRLIGGGVQGKINYINGMLGKYNVTNKPIILSEAGFLCKDCEPENDMLLKGKASYLTWLYVKNWAEGLKGVIWFTFDYPGWRNGSILGVDQSEDTLAYNALSFLSHELENGEYRKMISGLPDNAVGFEFSVPNNQRIWVLFSIDNNSYQASLPSGIVYIKDHLGEIVETNSVDNSVTVQPLEPIIIKMNR
jgi:hypothetical protein